MNSFTKSTVAIESTRVAVLFGYSYLWNFLNLNDPPCIRQTNQSNQAGYLFCPSFKRNLSSVTLLGSTSDDCLRSLPDDLRKSISFSISIRTMFDGC